MRMRRLPILAPVRRRRVIESLRRRARGVVGGAVERAALALGYDLVPAGYHSVVTRVGDVEPEVWTRRSPLYGIECDSAEQLAWAERELRPFVEEFAADPPAGWTYDNEYFEAVDADVLYAVIRRLRPRRIVELGSGWSTRVIAAAALRNARDGHTGEVRVFDPYPRDPLPALDGVGSFEPVRAQDVAEEVFTGLEAGDVLFVDTSHTIKPGGDVNRVVLDILPRLAPGVMVHFHDILLPGEYHREWVDRGWHWGEAYLLQAFLALNRDYRIRFGASGVWLDHRERLRELVPGLREHRPSSLWIERVAAGT